MVLEIVVVLDWDLRQLDVDMVYLEAGVEDENYIELPEECRDLRNQFGLPKKAIYRLVHAGLLWPKTFGAELEAK